MHPPRPTPPPYAWATDFTTVGVTGTNGKTSTTFLVAACMRAAGHGVVRMGTLGCHVDPASKAAPGWRSVARAHNAQGFYDVLQHAHALGIAHAAVEVTSQALARAYAKRWRFDHAVFTNLSPDHRDAHGSWEHYLAAKAQLFVHLGPGRTAVLNAADPHALFVDQAMAPDIVRCWYRAPSRGPALKTPAIEASVVRVSLSGTEVELAAGALAERFGGRLAVRMVGDVFAENAMAAAAVSVAAGIPASVVVSALAACPAVPGRFERVSTDPSVVVDFAHTPDAIARTTQTAKALVQGRGRLLVVMGAGGNRDLDKRGPMGLAAARNADIVYVTNDNPRDEDPAAIADAVQAGCRAAAHATVVRILDRRAAIEAAIGEARRGDLVVVAGKGHEVGQTIGGQTLPFCDADEVRRVTGQADARGSRAPRSC